MKVMIRIVDFVLGKPQHTHDDPIGLLNCRRIKCEKIASSLTAKYNEEKLRSFNQDIFLQANLANYIEDFFCFVLWLIHNELATFKFEKCNLQSIFIKPLL